MAIEINRTPSGSADAGMFNLPAAFDTKKYAAMWVENGQVSFKMQREPLAGTNKTADGWAVWKDDKKDKATEVQGSGNKRFTLMCRPREVQDQVNAIFGNVSKDAINREITGKTIAGQQLQDPGMLSERQLSGVEGGSAAAEESILPPNREEVAAAST